MVTNNNKAIDLMVEDLHRVHHEIRVIAKEEGCEEELNNIKQKLLDYLNLLKDYS